MHVPKIAALADSLNRIDKPTALAALERLMRAEALDADSLAILYRYLHPPSRTPKTPEQWVALVAANRSDPRAGLRCLYSDGTRLIATNGRQIHVILKATLPAGYYNKKIQPVECDYDYPNVDAFLKTGPHVDLSTLPVVASAALQHRRYRFKIGVGFDYSHVTQAMCLMLAPTVQVNEYTGGHTMYITDGVLSAVICAEKL